MRKPISAACVAKFTKPGHYAVGGGCYLQIAAGGSRSWVLRYTLGRARYMGLGSCELVTLAEARAKAHDARRLLLDKIDPIEARRAQHRERLLETARGKTFRECAESYIASHEAGWRDPRSHKQWARSLTAYVYPRLGDLPVAAIDTGLLMSVLEPIWKTKPETASRVRGRIENILDWARARGYRDGENPARWRGHLDHLLPARSRVRRVEHFAALSCARDNRHGGVRIVDAHPWFIVLAHKGFRFGAPLFRILIEELNAIPTRVGNCSNTSEHDDNPRLLP